MSKQAFFITSDDLFLLDSYKNTLIDKLNKEKSSEVIRLSCTGNENLLDSLLELTMPDLFANHKIVILTASEGKWHASTVKALEDLLLNINKTPHLTIIIALCEFKSQQLKTKAMQSIQKQCDIKHLEAPKGTKLDAWITAQAKKHRLSMDQSAIIYLKDHSKGHLYACDQLLQKAYLLGLAEIKEANLKQMMSDFSKYTIYDLISSLAQGDSHSQHILDYLLSQKTALTLILWNMINALKLAYSASFDMTYLHIPLSQAISKLWYQQKNDTEALITRLSFNDITRCLLKAYQLDYVIKRSGEAETVLALKELMAGITTGQYLWAS